MRILIEGIRGEILVSVLCSREGIGSAVVRQWQEAGIGALAATKNIISNTSTRQPSRITHITANSYCHQ